MEYLWITSKLLIVIVVLLLVLTYIGFLASAVGANLWLSEWSQDVNTSAIPAVRDMYLGVYGAFGLSQSILCYLKFFNHFQLHFSDICIGSKFYV